MVIEFLDKLSKKDNKKTGGKAAILGELISHDIPVPPGFVIPAEAYRSFLLETGIGIEIAAQWHELNPNDIHAIEEASRTIRSLFHEAPFSRPLQNKIIKAYQELNALYVAVRSSATEEDGYKHSWAGELESFMHITEENIIDRIKKCWSSLFTPRAINYRYAHELHGQDIGVAVIVQDMIDSDVSGVCFTVHPITKDPNELLIEAAWGLGISIAENLVTPDSYIYDRKEKTILKIVSQDQKIKVITSKAGETEEIAVSGAESSTQKLTEKEIIELSELCISIEEILKAPQDIEWVLEDGQFLIVQSRPITSL